MLNKPFGGFTQTKEGQMQMKLIGFITGIVFSVGLMMPHMSWGAYIYQLG